MKKYFVLILIAILVLSGSAFARRRAPKISDSGSKEVKFRDVPDTHWAAKSVYKLVKMGVTQGYPDGTFRGTKNITRFETAMFLSKLAENLGEAGMDKLSAELRSELKSMRAEFETKPAYTVSGIYEAKYYWGNLLASSTNVPGAKAPSGPVLNYRLRSTFASDIGTNANVKINLDTMDGGYYGGSENLLSKLLDIEGNIKFDSPMPLAFKVTSGPGPQQHLFNSPIMPSEYGVTYLRPYNSMGVSTKIYGADVGLIYTAHNVSTNDATNPGLIGVNQYTGTLGWAYTKVPILNRLNIALEADYYVDALSRALPVTSNMKPKMTLTAVPSDKVKISTTIGMGSVRAFDVHELLLTAGLSLLDAFNTGTNADINLFLVGNNYLQEPQDLDEWAIIGFDPFNRPRVNGSKAIQADVTQSISDNMNLEAKGTINLSPDYQYGQGKINSRMTYELDMNLGVLQSAVITAGYRIDMDPNAADATTDLLIVGMSNRF